jgi:hypothetical protein
MSTEKQHNTLEIKKNVLMLMPFRSGTKQGRMQSRLENMRIKYIIENLIDISWRNTEVKIKYTVKIAITGAGEVKNVIEDDFENADLFIALMSEKNVNVIYEIAVVNILQKNIIDRNESGSKNSIEDSGVLKSAGFHPHKFSREKPDRHQKQRVFHRQEDRPASRVYPPCISRR